ncbi:MAG: toxic anion resistance protein, partial [Lachnospiraceae bacterium]|nr:toxic anion resistance protein [Lachnospiraceae bacterium]
MANEFENMQTAPVLTLEPFKEEETAMQVIEEKEVIVEEPVLTPEEQAAVDAFANQIDLTNSNMILQYGAGTQKKMADFSENALDKVRSKDLGEVGALLTDVVAELKDFDIEEEEKGFLGFFKKSTNKLEKMKLQYAKAETNIN